MAIHRKKIAGTVVALAVLAMLVFIYLRSPQEESTSSSINSFQVTINKLGSFPCYNTVTTLIKDTGEVTSTRVVKNPNCVDPSHLTERTDAYKLDSIQLASIKERLQHTNVFSLKDSYINNEILDYAGERWEFIIDGQRKEIEVRVTSSDDLPSKVSELLNAINTTVFSGRYPL